MEDITSTWSVATASIWALRASMTRAAPYIAWESPEGENGLLSTPRGLPNDIRKRHLPVVVEIDEGPPRPMTVAPVIRSQRTHVWLKRQQVDLRPLGVTLGGQDAHLRLELRHAREAQRQEGRRATTSSAWPSGRSRTTCPASPLLLGRGWTAEQPRLTRSGRCRRRRLPVDASWASAWPRTRWPSSLRGTTRQRALTWACSATTRNQQGEPKRPGTTPTCLCP